jgi:hypothetical protein
LRGKQESTNKKDLFLKISLSTAVNGQTEMGRRLPSFPCIIIREKKRLSAWKPLKRMKKRKETDLLNKNKARDIYSISISLYKY